MQSILQQAQDAQAVSETSSPYSSVVRGIHFVDYEFSELPHNIGQLFPLVTQCSFYKCHQFTSFSSTLQQFSSLTTLAARDCPALTSLCSLSDIPPTTSLQAIRINNCGLTNSMTSNQTTTTNDGNDDDDDDNGNDDDWEDAMRALGNTPSSGLVLNLTSCQQLKRLPTSLRHLRTVLSCLRLETNYNLNHLPESLGELNSMVEFQLINCPSIHSLPPSMQRLKGDCQVSITGNSRLITRISHDSNLCRKQISVDFGYGVGTSTRWASSYFSQKISRMKPYYHKNRMRQFRAMAELSILFQKSRYRAIHRIYRPGGAGFQRCRDNFQMTVQEWSSGRGIVGGGTGSVVVDSREHQGSHQHDGRILLSVLDDNMMMDE
jgi:hypothetical protein